MAESFNSLAVSLYDALLNSGRKGENIFFSPASIFMALSMTYCGTRNNTAKQMKELMKLDGEPDDQTLYAKLTQVWADAFQCAKPHVTIELANRLWVQKKYPIEEHFQEILLKQYKADAFPVDFSNASEESRTLINSWVEKQTKNKIADVVPPGSITSLTRFVITNAIYFNGKWQSEFNKKNSLPMKFYTSPSSTVDAFAMFQKNHFVFVEEEQYDCKMLTMPYKGSKIGMTIILPNKLDGLSDLEVHMNDLLKTIPKGKGKRMAEVKVYIPRFKFTISSNVKELLIKLGVTDLFSEDVADLTGMSNDEDLYLNDVIHQAFIDVHEEGTEAAAAFLALLVPLCAMTPKPVPLFKADHPFMFLLHDLSSNVVLFFGKVCNPTLSD